jgi:hypothetical protein
MAKEQKPSPPDPMSPSKCMTREIPVPQGDQPLLVLFTNINSQVSTMIDTYLYRYWTYAVGRILSGAAQYHQVFGNAPTPYFYSNKQQSNTRSFRNVS